MLNCTKVDVWAATCEDRPGGLMEKLEGLARTGASLELVMGRRLHAEKGKGVVLIAPIAGERQERVARELNFEPAKGVHVLRVEGPDEPGEGYLITRALASERINLSGLSGATFGKQFVMFLAFDTAEDAERAIARLQRPL